MGTSGLGTLLVEDGLLTESDRRTIWRTCGGQGSSFARGVLATGLLDEDELAAFIAEKTRWKVAPKGLFKQSKKEVWGIIDQPLIERLEVLPLFSEGRVLHVAMVDPLDQDTLRQLAFFTGYKIAPVISTLTEIRNGLKKLLSSHNPIKSQLEDFLENHAGTASRRTRLAAAGGVKKRKEALMLAQGQALGEGGVSSADSPANRGGGSSAWASPDPTRTLPQPQLGATQSAPQSAAGATVGINNAGADEDDDLEFSADDELFQEGASAQPTASGSADIDADFDADGDFGVTPSPAEASAAAPPQVDAESLDGLGEDIDNLDLGELDDDLFGEKKPTAIAVATNPTAEDAQLDFDSEGGEPGDGDVDLSAFDADMDPAPALSAASDPLSELDGELGSTDTPMAAADGDDFGLEAEAPGELGAATGEAPATLDDPTEDLGDFGLEAEAPGELGAAAGEAPAALDDPAEDLGDFGLEAEAPGELGAATGEAPAALDDPTEDLGDFTAAPGEHGDDLDDTFGGISAGASSTEAAGSDALDLESGDEPSKVDFEALDSLAVEVEHSLSEPTLDIDADLDELPGVEPAVPVVDDYAIEAPVASALAVDIDVGGDDPLLATPTAAEDSARRASGQRNRDLLRKIAEKKH